MVDHAQRLADSALPGILLRLHELSGTALPSAPLGPAAAGSTADAHYYVYYCACTSSQARTFPLPRSVLLRAARLMHNICSLG